MLCACLLTFLSSAVPELPTVAHYDLRFGLAPARGRLEAEARMVIRNPTGTPVAEIPLVLYRLFTVSAVSDEAGRPLEVSQSVRRMADPDRFQVLHAVVSLREPLRPGDSTVIRVHYEGPFLGATEVWPYLHDRVSEEFTLIRPDALGYPVISDLQRMQLGLDQRFTATVDVSVPPGYVVASGGIPAAPDSAGDRVRYRFAVSEPTWRLDVAAARFRILREGAEQLAVYHLASDSAGAVRVLEAARMASATLRGWFGPRRANGGLTIIEIPEGWGSQAGDGYMLQAGGAFLDPARVGEVYHETAHGWNATARPDLQPTRWFDEAFASYFQALLVGQARGPGARDSLLARYRASFRRAASRDTLAATVPIARYGGQGLGGLSYSKGAWSLHVLHLAMGDERFRLLIRRWLEADRTPQTFEGFVALARTVGGEGVTRWAEEWLYGSASSGLLVGETPGAAIAGRYQGTGPR